MTPAGQQHVVVHLFDPYPAGPGAVWRPDQSPLLLMNTVASQVTVFPDDSVVCDGPVRSGPSLYDWARGTGRTTVDLPRWVVDECRLLGPNDYPSRALYGHYLRWVLEQLRETAPSHVSVIEHRAEVIDIADDADGRQVLMLGPDGARLTVDAVVLTLGHLPELPTAEERRLGRFAAHHGLRYQLPANPADVPLHDIPAGEPVILRGLGLNFFDYVSLLTEGRGGRFRRHCGGLRYLPSGQEPQLFAGSRRGVPLHARGENQKGVSGRHEPRFLTPEVISEARARASRSEALDFTAELWPMIKSEVESVYYHTLHRRQAGRAAADRLRREFVAAPPDRRDAVLDGFGIPHDRRWDWQRLLDPVAGRTFDDPASFTEWLLGYLRDDVREARSGNVDGPLKAALDALRDLRNEVRLLVDHGGVAGRSYREDVRSWYTPLNAYLSIGPPVSRVEEMIALLEAGVLRVLGPGTTVVADEESGRFLAWGSTVANSEVRATVLIEARLPTPDLARASSPLLNALIQRGEATEYTIHDPRDGAVAVGGLAVGPRPYPLLDARGTAHARRFCFGVPTEGVHWVTAAGARPGVNSVMLQDADAVARAALRSASELAGTLATALHGARRGSEPGSGQGSVGVRQFVGDRHGTGAYA